jgi:hypothetical protein
LRCKTVGMKIHITRPLFAWACLEDSPSLVTLREVLALFPDAALLTALREARGKGRDDYPVEVLWGTLLLQIILRHATMEACLGELRRNPPLRALIGIKDEGAVPGPDNMSRFLKRLGEPDLLLLLTAAFEGMVGQLAEAVPDLGVHTAGDSTGLSARPHAAEGKEARVEATSGLPEANGGRKEYLDAQGAVERVVEWFGHKLHLLVDVKHEVALAYRVTSATAADVTEVPPLVAAAEACLPPGRMKTLAYDLAGDDQKLHALLAAKRIKPLIEMRALWSEETERMLPGHTGRSNIVYDEAGTVYCYDKVSDPPVKQRMAYLGHEAARGTLKYRCPACHGQWRCPSQERCNAGRPYGLTVRVKQELDLRRFPPIPRATKEFERLYKGRTAVERVNARLKVFWGVDDGNLVGARRFHAQVGVVMLVHAAFATLLARAPRWEGTLSHTRLGPIQKALRASG